MANRSLNPPSFQNMVGIVRTTFIDFAAPRSTREPLERRGGAAAEPGALIP